MDLAEFGPALVSIACGEWRQRPGGRRPTPGDIRLLCVQAQRERPDLDGFLALEDMRAITHRRRQDRERSDAEMKAEGRRVADDWAQAQGLPDIAAYIEAEGIDWPEAATRVSRSILAAGSSRGANAKWRGSASALGATTREYAPTAEDLRQGRAALGLEAPPAHAQEAV